MSAYKFNTTPRLVRQHLPARPAKVQQSAHEYLQRDVENSCSLWTRIFTKPGKRYGSFQWSVSGAKRNPATNLSYRFRKIFRQMQAAGHEQDDLLLMVADLDTFVRALYANDACVVEASVVKSEADASEDVARHRFAVDRSIESLMEWREKLLSERSATDAALIAANRELEGR